MTEEKTYTLSQAGNVFAVEFHSKTWDLLDQPERSAQDNERMVDYAHASLAHWRTAGGVKHHQRGEWLLARVYSVLGEGTIAVRHALRCLALLEGNKDEMADFDFAFAYEAVARAYAVSGQKANAQKYIEMAQKAGEAIKDDEDRRIFFNEFNSGEWRGVRQPRADFQDLPNDR